MSSSSSKPSSKPSSSTKKKGAEFLHRNRFKNSIPDLPLDPKALKYPFPDDLLVKYQLSSLEKYSEHDILFLDSILDTISLGTFDSENFDSLPTERRSHYDIDPRDEAILIDPDDLGASSLASMARIRTAPDARPEGMAPNAKPMPSATNVKSQPKRSTSPEKPSQVLPLTDKSRQNQIEIIESTFVACAAKARAGMSHPTKPGVHAVDIVPVLPNLNTWPVVYAHVSVDDQLEPDSAPITSQQQDQSIGQPPVTSSRMTACLRPKTLEETQTTVFGLYQLNAAASPPAAVEDQQPAEQAFDFVRSYTFESKQQDLTSKMAFTVHPRKSVYYTPFRSRIVLSKYRPTSFKRHQERARLLMTPRDLTPDEQAANFEALRSLHIAQDLAEQYANLYGANETMWNEIQQ